MFINPDPDAAPLQSHLGDLTEQFAAWPLEDRFTQVHVAKVIRCNWKVAQEAFMEAMHVVTTHPQLLASIGDANTQYDAFENYSRAMTANGTPSPHLRWEPTEQQILDSMYDRNLDDPPLLTVPDGETARRVAAASRRDNLRQVLGDACRRPVGRRGERQLLLHRLPQLPPVGRVQPHRLPLPPAWRRRSTKRSWSACSCLRSSPAIVHHRLPVHWLGADDDWTQAPELGSLARVFNQDTFNLPNVQRGLKASPYERVNFARYEETKIRHFHKLLDEHIAQIGR